MNDITFMNDFIRMAKPKLQFRHALQEEGRLLIEMDRAEKLASTAHERKREEIESEKIKAALIKEKHDTYVTQKRQQQLIHNTDELRRLQNYITTAETASDLVAQLKLQEEKIERRFDEAKKQAEELRAEYRTASEREKQFEEQKRLEGKKLREHLKAQMAVHEIQRAEEMENKLKDGEELRNKLNKLDEEDRIKEEAALKSKLKMRQDILETLRKRQEIFKIQKAKDMTSIKVQYEAQKRLDELEQRIKHCRHLGIQRRRKISEIIGQKVYEIEHAKRQAIDDQIDMFVNEQQAKEQQADHKEIEKELETRRMLQNEVMLHLERKRVEKERQHASNMEIASQRKPFALEEQDHPRGKLRSQSQLLQTQNFMAEKLEWDRERFKREAKERRKLHELLLQQAQARDNEIEAARNEILNKKPLQLLRFFPTSVVRSDYLPQPLCDKVREAVRQDPIPMLSKKRHQPHLRGHHNDEPQQVKCMRTCNNLHVLSNVF